jgi:hypothetical protein
MKFRPFGQQITRQHIPYGNYNISTCIHISSESALFQNRLRFISYFLHCLYCFYEQTIAGKKTFLLHIKFILDLQNKNIN